MSLVGQTKMLCALVMVFLLLSLSCRVLVPSDFATPEAEARATATSGEGDMEFTYLIIRQAMQASYRDNNLQITASRFREEEYIDQHGATQTGPTCGLLMTLRDDMRPYQGDQYHVGQQIVYGKYLVKVVEIDRDDNGAFVRVGVAELDEVGVEWPLTVAAEGTGPYEIPGNTQLIYVDDNLLIGTGNFSPEKYDQATGRYDDEAEGPRMDTAVLWLTVRDGSESNQHLRVHGGQEVAYGQYAIRIVEVRDYFYRIAEDIDREDFTPAVLVHVETVGGSGG